MVKIENDCVECPQGCIGCGANRTPHYYCDRCGEEGKLYNCDGEQICIDCLMKMFPEVEGSDVY